MHALQRMPLEEYLQTREWKDRKERMLQHVGYRCQLCNGKRHLSVQHRTYERRGNELDADLIVLCRRCDVRRA